MKISSKLALVGLGMCMVVGLRTQPIAAQTGTGGQVELGAYGTMTKYDSQGLAAQNQSGAGGRLGFFFSRVFALEGSGDLTQSALANGDQVDVTRLGGSLVAYGHVASWNAFYLGAGYERLLYRGGATGEEDGGHIILGNRTSLGGRAALRLEGRGSVFPGGAQRTTNLSATVGISVFAFGGSDRDADLDLVADKRDRCPDTPRGASVDAEGCPGDSDSDFVLNGIDSCPDTPIGATVDQVGCPSDTDIDGVLDGIDQCADTPSGAAADANGCPFDTDGDSVFDGLDVCPDTPEGAVVDLDGCPHDGDGDNVFDGIDLCPETPTGATVDENGCRDDDDSDGVANSVDQCPDTPAGSEVNERGCAVERDGDGDGVVDAEDRCPNTASGQAVDAAGCPVLFLVAAAAAVPSGTAEADTERGALVLRGVTFQVSRSVLTEDSYNVLDQVAASLLEYPEIRVEVAGHTDATGTNAINDPLSRARAQAVMAYLAQRGVPPERMEARGYGSKQPIAPNSTRAGRARNRRVELKVAGVARNR